LATWQHAPATRTKKERKEGKEKEKKHAENAQSSCLVGTLRCSNAPWKNPEKKRGGEEGKGGQGGRNWAGEPRPSERFCMETGVHDQTTSEKGGGGGKGRGEADNVCRGIVYHDAAAPEGGKGRENSAILLNEAFQTETKPRKGWERGGGVKREEKGAEMAPLLDLIL